MKTKKRTLSFGLMILVSAFLFSCKTGFRPDPPFAKLDPAFTEVTIDPVRDSTYTFTYGSRIKVSAGTFLDAEGKPIDKPFKLRFRQFDDAVGVFLAGMPMAYGDNMVLKTAGMFEIRAEFNGKQVTVNPEKPVVVSVASNDKDFRQGFFRLDEENGQWNLIDIPDKKLTDVADSLKLAIEKLKPEVTIPLGPNFYVLSYHRMADICIGEDEYWKKDFSEKAMRAYVKKMKSYGVNTLNLDIANPSVTYKGNYYDVSELLWKTKDTIKMPKWAKKITSSVYYWQTKKEWMKQEVVTVTNIGKNMWRFHLLDFDTKTTFNFDAEVVCHLRYLLRYTPEALLAKQAAIEKEIDEMENRIRSTRIIEYTAEIYGMGIYNCDRPIYFRINYKPEMSFTIDGKEIKDKDVRRMAVFNDSLTSVGYASGYNPVVCPFFKGTNKIVVITNDDKIGVLTGKEFLQMEKEGAFANEKVRLVIPLKSKPLPESEAKFREYLTE